MAGVLVFGDTVGGKLAPASLEMAVAGAALAQALPARCMPRARPLPSPAAAPRNWKHSPLNLARGLL